MEDVQSYRNCRALITSIKSEVAMLTFGLVLLIVYLAYRLIYNAVDNIVTARSYERSRLLWRRREDALGAPRPYRLSAEIQEWHRLRMQERGPRGD